MSAAPLDRSALTRSVITVLDPVCRMEIRPDQAAAEAILDGWRRFYFCSPACEEAFLDIPHTYVGWSERAGRREAVWPPPLAHGERPR
jgi:YHS domain-containing protein